MMRRKLDPTEPRCILVRGANWVGDAVMSLPFLRMLRSLCPQAELIVLARPWVADVYAHQPEVSRVFVLEDKQRLRGVHGLFSLGRRLSRLNPDWIILLPHSFRSALLSWLAGAPVRVGYARDGRSFLLSHAVRRPPGWERMHHTAYYLYLLHQAGLLPEAPPLTGAAPQLYCSVQDEEWSADFLQRNNLSSRRHLLGVAPGTAFGPAKRWPVERFADAAGQLAGPSGAILLLGSMKEMELNAQLAGRLKGFEVVNLAGSLSLGRTLALMGRLSLMLANDSGLMHAAAALGTPTAAVFGSTSPVRTAPLGPAVRILHHETACSPCLQRVCSRPEMICFGSVSVEEVVAAGREIMRPARRE